MFAVSKKLNQILPEEQRMKMKYYTFSCLTGAIYPFIFFMIDHYYPVNSGENNWFALFIIIHLSVMFNILYTFYFTAKITSKTLNYTDNSDDYTTVNFFFGYWIGYIGVWSIQPKIQRAIESHG